MKLFRCNTCGFVLTPSEERYLLNHVGHKFTTGGNIKFFEYPKVWIWRVSAWLRK